MMRNVSMILCAMQVDANSKTGNEKTTSATITVTQNSTATANLTGTGTVLPNLKVKKSTHGECNFDCGGQSGTFTGIQLYKFEICDPSDNDCQKLDEKDNKGWETCQKICNRDCSLDTSSAGLEYTSLVDNSSSLQCGGDDGTNNNTVIHGTIQWMKCHDNEALPAQCNDGTWKFQQDCKKKCTMQTFSDQGTVQLLEDLNHKDVSSAKCNIKQPMQQSGSQSEVLVKCNNGELEKMPQSQGSCLVPCEHNSIEKAWPTNPIKCKKGYSKQKSSEVICENLGWEARYRYMDQKEKHEMKHMDQDQVCRKQCEIYKGAKALHVISNYEYQWQIIFPILHREKILKKFIDHDQDVEVILYGLNYTTKCIDGVLTMSDTDLAAHKLNAAEWKVSKRRSATSDDEKLNIA